MSQIEFNWNKNRYHKMRLTAINIKSLIIKYLGNFFILNVLVTNMAIAQTFAPVYVPDLPLETATSVEIEGVQKIYEQLADEVLGKTPSGDFLSKDFEQAKTRYNGLNIVVDGNTISGGESLTAFQDPYNIIKQFAIYLRFYPDGSEAEAVKEMASNVIWVIAQRYVDGSIPFDHLTYEYDAYGRATIFHGHHLSDHIKDLVGYTIDTHSRAFYNLWPDPTTGEDYYPGRGYSSDWIYNLSDIMLGYGTWLDTDDEKVRWMKAIKRYYERFFTISEAFSDGIKPDGAGFHHWASYSNYMYAYKTTVRGIYSLSHTPFRISAEHYKTFRDAVYYQLMISSDSGVLPISMCGRKPESRDISSYDEKSIRLLAIAGGDALGLPEEDPILAGHANRVWGSDALTTYSGTTPFTEGFFQMNYAHLGVYRKNNWVASFRGLSDYMWGAEIYQSSNRFGRYQSYGTLEIAFDGSLMTSNAYDANTWNWNHYPGTTSILLPFDMLHAERGRIDEKQLKSFAGALAFQNKGGEALTDIYGNMGMFAMDFHGEKNQGFSTTHGPSTHDGTFKFKKSVFAFDDIIISLGSDIENLDDTHPTITTLYQRLQKSKKVVYNGEEQPNEIEKTFDETSDYWVLSNVNTGYYVVNGGQLSIFSGKEPTPNHDEIVKPGSSGWTSNTTRYNTYGYLSHGVSPAEKGYEYVCIPSTTASDMENFATTMSSEKPYKVLRKSSNAHIVQHVATNTIGSAFFSINKDMNVSRSEIMGNDTPCLVMYQLEDGKMTLTMVNPNLGFESRQEVGASQVKQVKLTLWGQWALDESHENAEIMSADEGKTVVKFQTIDGLPVEVVLSRIGEAPERPMPLNATYHSDLIIYPNPVDQGTSITIQNLDWVSQEVVSIKVIDIFGRVITEREVKIAPDQRSIQVDTQTLQSGLYLIEIEGKSNKYVKRLMIE